MNKVTKIGILWEQRSYGGVDSYLAYLLSSSTFDNIEVVLFTNNKNQGFLRLEKILKGEFPDKNPIKEVILFRSFNSLQSNFFLFKILIILFKPLFFLFSILQTYFLIKNYKFDVFLGQCGGYGDFRTEMAGIFSSRFCKIPVRSLVIHHECIPSNYWSFFLKIVNNFISQYATSIISVSEATKKSLTNKSNLFNRYSLMKSLVIYPGYPVNKKDSLQDNFLDNFKSQYRNEDIKIGMLSRIDSYKGHEDLIFAASYIPYEIRKKLKFFFIGSGSEEEITRLKTIIKNLKLEESFIFTGFVDFTSLSIVRKLDLLVSLTRNFEGFGSSVAEAMSIGTPVLCTNVGAMGEYLNENYVGLIKPNNINVIADSLIEFLNNSEKWNSRAVKAKEYIIKEFNSDKISKEYIEHFERTLNQY
jgi:glycosyltransferase involved in cell wall biosynthesis